MNFLNRVSSIKQAIAFIILISYGLMASAQSINKHKLDSLLSALESQNAAMGCLTITQQGKTSYNRAIGLASLGPTKPTPATTTTLYRVGSVTKMFTAVMILQLIEEGKLTLDTRLSVFYPTIPNAATISIAQLLNHHSGLANYTNSPTYKTWSTTPQSHQALLDTLASYKPLFEPGIKGEYSNSNYLLLGYIVEKIDGKSYPQILKKRITERLGLRSTFAGEGPQKDTRQSDSYEWRAGKWIKRQATDVSVSAGAGAIVSTTNDLTTFITGLFSGKLLTSSSLRAMKTIVDGYGMGLFAYPKIGSVTFTLTDQVAYGHIGEIDGYASVLAYLPESEIAVAYCTNGINMDYSDVIVSIFSCIH